MSRSYFKGFGTGSNSNGQFWYGDYGFLYKKNTGVGGRKNPLYGLICNRPTELYNKYKPGTGGVGAQSKANRRAVNKRSTVCLDHNCGIFYNYLGLYPRFSYNSINGYFPYPLPLETNFIVNGEYKSFSNQIYDNIIMMYGETSFVVTGIKTLQVNYIFVGGGGGGGAGGSEGGGGGGGGGGGQISYGVIDLYPGRYTIQIGKGGNGGSSSLGNLSTNGSNGEQTLLYEIDSRKIRINAFGGQGGQYGFGEGYMDYDKNNDLKNTYLFGIGGNGGLSIKTDGTIGGSQSDENGSNGSYGGGGGSSNYDKKNLFSIQKGGDGSFNKSIDNNSSLIKNAIKSKITNQNPNNTGNPRSDISTVRNISNTVSNISSSDIVNISSTNINSDNSLFYISEIVSAFTSGRISSLNTFGTGAGAGNAGQKNPIIDFENLPTGGRGGGAGGITIGLGGIGYISNEFSNSTTPQNGENGREAIPFLGGGGGGGGGGTAEVNVTRSILQKTETYYQSAGVGGKGGKGGRGLAIFYFNIDKTASGVGTGYTNNIPQGIPTIQQIEKPGVNTTISTFSIVYNNGTNTSGSAPVDNLSPYISGSTVTILGYSNLIKTGYTFVGWNTQSNGSGTQYSISDSFQITTNVSLYPRWTLTRYSVEYDKNNILASTAPVDGKSPYLENSIVTVLGPGNMKSSNPLNEIFINWNTKHDASGTSYIQGDTFKITSNITLFGQWGFTITYNAGIGGSNPPEDSNSPYIKDSIVTVLGKGNMTNSIPGKTFKEWREDLEIYVPGDTFKIKRNTTLTAVWE